MHTFRHSDLYFLHHGDFQGDVTIVVPQPDRAEMIADPIFPRLEVKVPAAAIRAFVAEQVRRERSAALEDASDEEILQINPLPTGGQE